MRRQWIVAGAALLAITSYSWLWPSVSGDVVASVSFPVPKTNEPSVTSTGDRTTTIESATNNTTETFAPSLRNTARDGQLRADANGNLIVVRGIRDLFDYYLTTLGENDLADIREQLRSLFERELPEPAATQASQLLDAYLLYRERAGELEQNYPQLTQDNAASVIADYFTARDALRQELFDADAINAFFEADINNEQAALPALSHETVSPRSDSSHNAYTLYRAEEKSLDTTSRDAMRAQLFGGAAAQRFIELDQKRDDWNTRLALYREQKRELLASVYAAGADPASLLKQLQESQFSGHELTRIRALDKLEAQGFLSQ